MLHKPSVPPHRPPLRPQVARLSALAQQATEEVMAAREAAQAERSRAEQLAHDKAELQGRVSAAPGRSHTAGCRVAT